MPRHAFTMFELMVAVALLVAIAAVATPAVVGRLGAARERSVSERLEAAAVLTRAQAQRSGSPVRLRAYPRADGPVRVYSERLEEGAAAEPGVRPAGAVLRLVLPDGYGVTTEPPQEEDEWLLEWQERGGAAGGAHMLGGLGEAGPEPVTLAVMMPDGTAAAGGAVYLTMPGGRTLVVGVNRWRGTLRLERWVAPADDFLLEVGGR